MLDGRPSWKLKQQAFLLVEDTVSEARGGIGSQSRPVPASAGKSKAPPRMRGVFFLVGVCVAKSECPESVDV